MTQTKISDKQIRLANFLSQFHFHIAHIPGKHNQVADALSRRPRCNAVFVASHNDLTFIVDEDATDPDFCDVKSAIALGKTQEPYVVQDDYLLYGSWVPKKSSTLLCWMNDLQSCLRARCYSWPAGIFLSEFLLGNPAIFSGQPCLEVGAGAGLSTICLGLLNASKVIGTDGNHFTLANLRHNIAINATLLGEKTSVEVHELCWESANEKVVTEFGAEIIVGADLIYDVSSIPHLVRLLTMLLSGRFKHANSCQSENSSSNEHEYTSQTSVHRPVAYLATVIRNVETMATFASSACQAGLIVEDVTETMRPPVFLPQITDIDRSAICLHRLTGKP
ncbi:hypothetical protein L7F22_057657 [Adiantum nelumboides]|nr:hypothetical protein [Adiantum nelumboides]